MSFRWPQEDFKEFHDIPWDFRRLQKFTGFEVISSGFQWISEASGDGFMGHMEILEI